MNPNMTKTIHKLFIIALMCCPISSLANSVKTISVVKDNVSITDDWDYTITSSKPFDDNGIVDIVNTEHAAVILQNVKPSAAIKLLSHIKINGEQAKNGTNCQVKIYNRGAIILPYGDSTKPLTVYSEPNFGGESVNDFGLEHSNGYMNTLSDAKLNNRIQSFKLKRGYMVTFSTRSGGAGYSRCFIAADKDLEIAELPTILNKTISSYRIFKWYDAGKKQLANDLTASTLEALNVQSSYTWSEGHDMYPDYECVPNHIYEDYPSSGAIGRATWSPHSKNNNEPRNPSDDHPQDLTTILNNWENMMRTGMRLCSPASWDGSDYWNATGFLAEFLDSIDARGWRCDIIDLHCYWAEGSFGNIANWVNKYNRPVWISEWCWGASWGTNDTQKGAFANGVTEAQVKTVLERICTNLNSWNYVERYYYWNGERDPSRLYKDGKLTEAGKYYASMNSGIGYNGKYDFVPRTPRQYGPQNFSVTYSDGQAIVKWRDRNGEYNQLMEVQRKKKGGKWEVIATIEQKENPANYTYTDTEATEDDQYRIYLKDIDGIDHYTDYTIDIGDLIETADGKQLYLGGNMIMNGEFDMGFTGWTTGKGTEPDQPQFQVVPMGGVDGGNYLQTYQSTTLGEAGSLKTVFDLTPNTYYLFSVATINGNPSDKLSLSADGQTEGEVVSELTSSTSWLRQTATFNSGQCSHAIMGYQRLGAAQIDEVRLHRLFPTYEEAIADGQQQELRRTEALEAYQRDHPDNEAAARKAALAQALQTIGIDPTTDIDYTKASVQPQSADLSSATGWSTKVGSYKSGDQRLNTVRDKTCWNAWWSGLNASTGLKNTMEIRQKVTNLEEGIYTMVCKAATEHYCLSDQHGYIVAGGDTARTEKLTADYFDLPNIANIWQTLTTLPVYVEDEGTATIGFKSSKQGAIDNAWHRIDNYATSDKREGWWCATDFELLYHPVHRITSTPGQWNAICLPYSFNIPEGLHVYELAGILNASQEVALKEVSETEPGMPYVYTVTTTGTETPQTFTLYEYGTKRTSAGIRNGFKGYFESTTVRSGNYVLNNNQWEKATTSPYPTVSKYGAAITRIAGLPALESWDGPTMKLVDPTVGISRVQTNSSNATKQYNLGGQPTSNPRGIYIKVENGQRRKQIAR